MKPEMHLKPPRKKAAKNTSQRSRGPAQEVDTNSRLRATTSCLPMILNPVLHYQRCLYWRYCPAQAGLRVSLTNAKYAAIWPIFFAQRKKASKASAPKIGNWSMMFSKIAFSMKRLWNAQTNLWLRLQNLK